jgi:hypothetical protein
MKPRMLQHPVDDRMILKARVPKAQVLPIRQQLGSREHFGSR